MKDDSSDDSGAEVEVYNQETGVVIESSPKNRFQKLNIVLGKGAFKKVYKGLDDENGTEIAWNVIKLNHLSKQDRTRINKEINLIKQLKHKNILDLSQAWLNKEKGEVVFITELFTGGSLRQYI